jgi:hypothetical protein
MTTKVFTFKAPAEKVPVTFDFTRVLGAAAISGTPTCAVALDAGATDDTADILDGAASTASGVVLQPVKAGTAGQDYRVTCTALTNDGRTLVLAGILPVRTA